MSHILAKLKKIIVIIIHSIPKKSGESGCKFQYWLFQVILTSQVKFRSLVFSIYCD